MHVSNNKERERKLSLKNRLAHLGHLNEPEWQRLGEIIKVCRQIQEEYKVIAVLKEKREKYLETLKGFCRQCKDENCEARADCEIKKAFASLDGDIS